MHISRSPPPTLGYYPDAPRRIELAPHYTPKGKPSYPKAYEHYNSTIQDSTRTPFFGSSPKVALKMNTFEFPDSALEKKFSSKKETNFRF
jgi:hypothetical protein